MNCAGGFDVYRRREEDGRRIGGGRG